MSLLIFFEFIFFLFFDEFTIPKTFKSDTFKNLAIFVYCIIFGASKIKFNYKRVSRLKYISGSILNRLIRFYDNPSTSQSLFIIIKSYFFSLV